MDDGWEFCVKHNGKIRLLVVAETDFSTAEASALSHAPGATTVSYQVYPRSVLEMQSLPRGAVTEWILLDPSHGSITPGGTTRGSNYDTPEQRREVAG